MFSKQSKVTLPWRKPEPKHRKTKAAFGVGALIVGLRAIAVGIEKKRAK